MTYEQQAEKKVWAQLEPGVERGLTFQDAALSSIAISLKRIADALEVIVRQV